MKKSLTLVTLLAGAVGAYAQGTISFSDNMADHNYTTQFLAVIWSPQVATPGVQQYGNSSISLPGGSTVYTGVPIGGGVTSGTSEGIYGNGSLWTAAFFAVPGVNNTSGLAAAEAAFTPISTSLFQAQNDNSIGTAQVSPGGAPGTWASNSRVSGSNNGKGVALPTTGLGPFPATGGATVQILVWYNAGGLTYANSTIEGSSEIVSIDTLGTSTLNAPNLGLHATGAGNDTFGGADPLYGPLTDFSLMIVPEPTTIALGVLGASVFLFRHRRK